MSEPALPRHRQSAPAYSLLAGTLAAVAFLAIIFLLEHSRRVATDLAPVVGLENVPVSLVSAFLNLVIATFLYAPSRARSR